MLYKDKQLKELYFLKHRHDSEGPEFDYENNLLDKSLSPYIYENDMMNGFLKRLQPLVATLFDRMNVMKNFKNYMVDRYHYRQRG